MNQEQPEEGQTNEVEPEVTEVEDIEALKQALVEEKKKAEANLANWQSPSRLHQLQTTQ